VYRGFVPSVVGICMYRGLYFGGYDKIRDAFLAGTLRGRFAASFTAAALASYPFNTIRRQMMMTSGEKVGIYAKHCNGTVDCLTRTIKAGAGENIFRDVAAAGALSLYNKLQELAWGEVYQV
ncbi:hypothetical protein K503DRAFT_689629, partial [Rhizopogon vinicolor AM-OR11-026]